jgi:transcriptional regulator with XRE-family HTH domain
MSGIIVPAQIRAARALLGWSQDTLANAASVGLNTIRDIERGRRGDAAGSLISVEEALRKGGVTFLPGNKTDGPGVRLQTKLPNIIRLPEAVINNLLECIVEWHGRRITLRLDRDVLDTFTEDGTAKHDEQRVALLNANLPHILERAAQAIDAGPVNPDGSVYLRRENFGRSRRP